MKISALDALAGASFDDLDLLALVDVSDTTMAATGTDKKATLADLVTYLEAAGLGGGGGGGSGVPHVFVKHQSSDITTSSGSYTDLSSALDLTIAAAAGDTLEVSASMVVSHNTNLAETCFDAYTRVAGAGVNYISGTHLWNDGSAHGDGIPSWKHRSPGTNESRARGGSFFYTVQAGDISAGTVTLRVQWKTSTGTAKVLSLDSNLCFQWAVKNLGPHS